MILASFFTSGISQKNFDEWNGIIFSNWGFDLGILTLRVYIRLTAKERAWRQEIKLIAEI